MTMDVSAFVVNFEQIHTLFRNIRLTRWISYSEQKPEQWHKNNICDIVLMLLLSLISLSLLIYCFTLNHRYAVTNFEEGFVW